MIQINASCRSSLQSTLLRLLPICLLAVVVSGWVDAGELKTPNKFGGDFRFQSTLGEPVAISQFKGKVVLLNFGFTSCPDICPMVLSELTTVQNTLDKDGEKLQVIFVTVDPERDNLETLQKYLAHFHESFVGMRDDNINAVRAVMQRYGAALVSDKNDISHTDYVYVINKEGYVSGFYGTQSNRSELMDAVKKAL